MTIQQELLAATNNLKKTSKTASLDAEVLLSFILKKPKTFLYAHPEKELTRGQQQRFEQLIGRRARREPVAYLTNHKEFYGLDFFVDCRVLIPRFETELLVDEVVEHVAKVAWQRSRGELSIADIGTGSGAIVITLTKILPTIRRMPLAIRYYGTDISRASLAVARKNAAAHRVNVTLLRGSLLAPLKGKRVDILVANLPYLTPAQYQKNRGLRFEPQSALVAGRDGLEAYRRLFKHLERDGLDPRLIICEIDPSQRRLITALGKRYFPAAHRTIKKDFAGRNRMFVIEKLKRKAASQQGEVRGGKATAEVG